MDDFSPRQRNIKREAAFSSLQRMKTDLTLPEILVVFTASSSYSTMPGLYDPVSISLRALFLCELVLHHGISIDPQKAIHAEQSYMPLDEVHDEVYAKIKGSKKQRTAEKWLLLLNGESYALTRDRYHIKNARRRVTKGLVDKGVLRKQKNRTKEFINFITNKTANNSVCSAASKGMKSKICEEITAYLTGATLYEESAVLKLNILVCSLAFCCVIEDVYLTLPPSQSEAAQKRVNEIIMQYKTGLGDTTQKDRWSIYSILRGYLKLGTWV